MRILIVDDIPFVRKAMNQILTRLGHEIVGEATNGREAIDLYVQTQPDFVLMDLAMPLMNGIEATRQIMKINSQANVVILSSLTQENLISEAILAGAKDYVVKPFEASEVERVLNHPGEKIAQYA